MKFLAGSWVFLVGLLVVFVTCATGYWSALTFTRVSRDVADKVSASGEAIAVVQGLERAIEDENEAFLEAVIDGPDRARSERDQARERFEASFARLEALIELPEEETTARALRRDVDAYRQRSDVLLVEAHGSEAETRYHRDVTPLLRQVLGHCMKLREERRAAAEVVAAWGRDEARRVTYVMTGVSLLALLLSVVLRRSTLVALTKSKQTLEATLTELVRLDEMRLELVAVASHELRTPVTTLRMTLTMLEEGAAKLDPRQRELVATALLGCDQLSTTVNEFLDLTRIEAGELRLAFDRVDIVRLADQAMSAFHARYDEAGVELSRSGIPSVVVPADAARLRAVLSNLLSNALAYTPRGGSVLVVVAHPSPSSPVTIEVTDTGAGVPAEYRERVFEKFFRVEQHRTTTDADRPDRLLGVGIGLYVSREIVEAHGGTIQCEDGEEGKGTRLRVSLPSRMR